MLATRRPPKEARRAVERLLRVQFDRGLKVVSRRAEIPTLCQRNCASSFCVPPSP